jgi:hypothetical protein
MLFALLLAAPLALSPDLPKGVPDIARWKVEYTRTLDRTLFSDLLRIGGLTLKFVQQRGLCPEGSPPECSYRVNYEFRRVMQDGKMTSFIQRFVAVGANGVREEGFAWFEAERLIVDPRRAVLIYYRKGDRWINEDTDCEELETAKDYFMMLAELHEKQ